ncbi:MAG: hypothetical protein U0232_06175 [Thermomicrobiales bacterium]
MAPRESWPRSSRDSAEGPSGPPAQLALATILQAYRGSDDEALEALVMDRRRQLCWTARLRRRPRQGDAVRFPVLIAHDLDRRLVERTVDGQQRGGFGSRQLRGARQQPAVGCRAGRGHLHLLGHASARRWRSRASRGGAGGGRGRGRGRVVGAAA